MCPFAIAPAAGTWAIAVQHSLNLWSLTWSAIGSEAPVRSMALAFAAGRNSRAGGCGPATVGATNDFQAAAKGPARLEDICPMQTAAAPEHPSAASLLAAPLCSGPVSKHLGTAKRLVK